VKSVSITTSTTLPAYHWNSEVGIWNSYPGEDWQLHFTQLPWGPISGLLLVLVDTFSVWVEAYLCSSEKAQEVIKVLINKIIPTLGLPGTLQKDNGLAF
jgi:hypothetical protein